MNGVTYRTVWNWVKKGNVKYEIVPSGSIFILEDEPIKKEKRVVVYCRVSSYENKSNLDSQSERVINYCNAKGWKVNKVVKEIGSGLNDNRPKLNQLLKDNSYDVIVIEHKDRLTRFGFNYINTLLENQNRKIEIINSADDDRADLIQDFVSVITSFCARIYGSRRSKRKTEQIIKELEKEDEHK